MIYGNLLLFSCLLEQVLSIVLGEELSLFLAQSKAPAPVLRKAREKKEVTINHFRVSSTLANLKKPPGI